MGLFSKRRNAGFDPELWSDPNERAKARGTGSWFDDLGQDEPGLDDLETNAGARFDDDDSGWLDHDPGEAVRRSRR